MPTSTTTPEPAPVTSRVWPFTALLVLLGLVLVVVDGFGAAITTAPFFGDMPSRAQYVGSGVVMVSVVLPLGVLVAAGWCLGSRWGLLLLVVPAIVSALIGTSLLTEVGDSSDPDPGRAVRMSDWGTDLNYLNGVALLIALLLLAGAVVSRRRRAGAAARGSSSSSAS